MANLKDMKASLSSSYKPDITHVRSAFLAYTARPSEYGEDKYERANYQRSVAPEGSAGPTAADVKRFRAYLRAAAGHIFQVLDALEKHQANDPNFEDVEGFKKAAYAIDTDTKVGDKVGPSLLPHVAPACASLNMAITQAVNCGLLPADPGTPWRDATKDSVKS